MKFTAQQIAGILEGDVVGNPNAEVSKLSKIEEGSQGSLTFLANPKYKHYIYSTKASVTIVNKTFVSPGGEKINLDVELFTWEKLDYLPQVIEAFGL